MKYTTKLALKKPEYQDESDVEVLNENWDALDLNALEVQQALDDKADRGQVLTNVPLGAKFTDTVPTAADLNLDRVDNVKQMPLTGGEFTGVVSAKENVSYATKQFRNIIFSTGEADINQMKNGDIWIKYI